MRTNKDPALNRLQNEGLRVIVPPASWETIYFKEIDDRVKQANLPSLRMMLLPGDDLQVRLWFLAGPYGLDGIVIRRTGGVWSGVYLHGFSRDLNFRNSEEPLASPQSGWYTAWESLVNEGILTVADASAIGCNVSGKDGIAFVVETNLKSTYRTYMYDNPQFAECNEAKQMLRLIDTVNHEFGLQWPTTK